MGWEKLLNFFYLIYNYHSGKGLGKNENGIQDCIQVKKRGENLGV